MYAFSTNSQMHFEPRIISLYYSMKLEQHFENLIQEHGQIEQLCTTAIEHWRQIFDRKDFIENLESYSQLIGTSNPPDSEPLRKLQMYFKNVRKAGMYLRTTFIFFDQAHEDPERLHTFVWQLGQFNDKFLFPEQSSAHAEILKKQLALNENWAHFDIRPDSSENVLNVSSFPLYRLRALLESSQLKAEEFHELRKKLRLFANIYTLSAKKSHDVGIQQMKAVLLEINEELGTINDAMVQDEIRGIQPYDANVLTIPTDLQLKIKSLLSG